MRIEATRFGDIECDDDATLEVCPSLAGFPDETRFVLLRPKDDRRVAWLQSLRTPSLAFPVIDGTTIDATYPQPSLEKLANDAAFGEDVALLVLVAVRPGSTTLIANLLAPIVVDLAQRRGVQIALDPRKYSAATPLASEVLRRRETAIEEEAEPPQSAPRSERETPRASFVRALRGTEVSMARRSR